MAGAQFSTMSTVKIGKKHIQLNFGMAALADILNEFGVGLADLDKLGNITMLQAGSILYWGMYHHARQCEMLESFKLTKTGALDMLDNDPQPFEAVVRLMEAFTKAISDKSGDNTKQLEGAEKNG